MRDSFDRKATEKKTKKIAHVVINYDVKALSSRTSPRKAIGIISFQISKGAHDVHP